MKKPFKIAIGVAVVLLVSLQLVPVDRSNPPITAALQPDGEVGDVLRAACMDCHSNETVWPWYARVAPVSFFVADHVEEGREHLNLSTFGEAAPRRQDHMLEEFVEVLEEGEMPLRSYTLGHPEARLTDQQRQLLMEWARAERRTLQGAVAGSRGEVGSGAGEEHEGGH